jgi:hypothetical protein
LPHRLRRLALAGCALAALSAGAARAQEPAKVPAEPAPVVLAAPAMSPTLASNANPFGVDAGPLGKLYIGGQITGIGLAQSDTVPAPGTGNADSLGDLGSGMLTLQTSGAPLTFVLQVGAYSFATLGTPYTRASQTPDLTYSYVPVGYAKLDLGSGLSIQAGSMPTIIGAEYAFTYQNINIQRGLLWNQEPVISKGVQANYSKGPLNVSVSLTDGFYSDKFNWLAGLVTYAIDSHNTIGVNGGFNTGTSVTNRTATPILQNNSALILASWTYSNGPLWISPYFQYTRVDAEPRIGAFLGAETWAGAVLAKYSLTPEFSIGGRFEYISSSSDGCNGGPAALCVAPTNLLYGPNSDAYTLTVTPTWQKGIFFARGEASYVSIGGLTPGFGFGSAFNSRDQFRALFEVGVLF